MQRSYLHVDLLCEVGDSTPSEGSIAIASTANRESQGVNFKLCWWANSAEMKLPAAPESSKAFVQIVLSLLVSVMGILKWKQELTDLECGLRGRTGHDILRWPAFPQYKQRWCCSRRSRSSGVKCMYPSCMGSLSVAKTGLSLARVWVGHRDLIRLSIWMDNSMNILFFLPSLRHASSDWCSRLNPFRNSSFQASSVQSVCAARVRKDKAYSAAALLPWFNMRSCSPALLPPAGWSKTSLMRCKNTLNEGNVEPSVPTLMPLQLTASTQKTSSPNP